MGRRGPPKTPTKLLEARGSWRAKGRKKEPRAESARPRRPAWLSPAARRIWDRLLPVLDELGVLAVADVDVLARYVTLLGRWLEVARDLNRSGLTQEVEIRGSRVVVARPEVKLELQYSRDLLRIEREFGLSPAARAALTLGERDDADDPISALIQTR